MNAWVDSNYRRGLVTVRFGSGVEPLTMQVVPQWMLDRVRAGDATLPAHLHAEITSRGVAIISQLLHRLGYELQPGEHLT